MANDDAAKNSQAKCCGAIQEASTKSRERAERRRNKPQPWIVLKMTIGITLAIIAYASYVYIGRFCVPMIRKEGGPLGGRSIGIPFLVIFCVLLVMMLWAYAMVVFTGPGKARDYVEQTPAPVYNRPEDVPRWWDSTSDLTAGPYQYMPEGNSETQNSHGIEGSTLHSEPKIDQNAGITDGVPPIAAAHARAQVSEMSAPQANRNTNGPNQPPMMITRSPPKTPVLRPDHRYCHKEGFIKPTRAHHCRACGTCILKYDHHCPWIGQCVGAHNHKFFVHFLQWASIFCMWVFATLVAGVVNEGRHSDVDPQYIVIIALSALFTIFTLVLLATHIRLIVLNQSTVESMQAHGMKEREKVKLSRMYSWYQVRAKRETRRQWDRDWGNIDTEGNLWWLGSTRENWISVMGRSKWAWFLPVGHPLTDGINWLPNPRHDSEGRWRPRREWPAALQ